MGGDRDLLNQLIEIFLQDHKSLEGIREAVGRGDPEALNKSAHRLKGSLGTFAAHAAFEFAQELERIGISGVMSGAQEVLLELENEIARVKEALESLVKCEG
jgi:HPt (histidine-containing phosphotransfer) domain-containing protein